MTDENPNPPIKRLSDAELVRAVGSGLPGQGVPVEQFDDSIAAKERNQKRAMDELGSIEALRQNSAFQWFWDTCVEHNFRETRDTLEGVDLTQFTSKALTRLIATFQAWKKLARWLDERELEHRRLLNPKDPHLDVIRARLDLH